MKPHIKKFKLVFFTLLFFFAYNSYSQEESSISGNLDISIIDNLEKVVNANDLDENKLDSSKNPVVSNKEASILDNTQNEPVLIKAINGLNNKLETVIFENKMLTMRSNLLLSSIDRD